MSKQPFDAKDADEYAAGIPDILIAEVAAGRSAAYVAESITEGLDCGPEIVAMISAAIQRRADTHAFDATDEEMDELRAMYGESR